MFQVNILNFWLNKKYTGMFLVIILGIYRLKNVLNEHWQTRINEISLCWYIYDGLQKVVTTHNFSNFALCNYFLDNTLLILKKNFLTNIFADDNENFFRVSY